MTIASSHACFHDAATEVLRYLQGRLGFGLWMVTRTQVNDWIVLAAEDQKYGVTPGQVFNWADSFCSRMVQGHGPQVAPEAGQIPAYAEAPISGQIPIGAYIGVPIYLTEGSLFGTLCAVDPLPQPMHIVRDLPLVKMLGKLLSTILKAELEANEALRKAERAENEALIDELTGLYNRRGWDRLLAAEESRCSRYGSSSSIIVADLDNLKAINDTCGHAVGDELIRKAATAIQSVIRSEDVAARVGGDEFTILVTECYCADSLVERLKAALESVNVQASIGAVARLATGTLNDAWESADAQMYSAKRTRPSRMNAVLN